MQRPTPSQSLLVGRGRELAILRKRLAAALSGNGGLALIGGEAGIGKTALAEALCREAAEQGALVLIGRCYDLTETPPYGPWIELFGSDRREEGMPALPAAFAERGTVRAVASQATLVQQVLDFFVTLAARRPVVLLLDDLHWSDPASLDLLRLVARSLARRPLLTVVTYRADELTRRHPLYVLLPLLEREAPVTRLSLRALGHDAIERWVAAQYRLPAADKSRLVTHLEARAEGNAFFIAQLLHAFEESDVIRGHAGGWMLGDLTSVGLPLPLQQVIDGRLARLGEDAHRRLAMAAVIGQEVPIGLWAAVAEMDEETALAVVERATEARLADAVGDGEAIRFVHALVREALYEGSPPLRRRIWHRQVAEALIALPNADPDLIAAHFQRAGDARATGWLINAGEHAQRLYARATAAERYEAALALMEPHGGEASERGWLRYRLAVANAFADTPQAIARLQEAAQLAESANDRVLLANAVGLRGNLRVMYGEVRQGIADMERSVETFAALTPTERARLATLDVLWLYDEEFMRGALLADLGNAGYYAEALALGARIDADRPGPRAGEGETARIGTVEKGIALTYAALGRPEEARLAFGREREERQRHGDRSGLLAGSALNELRYVVLPYQTDDIIGRRQLAALAEEWYLRARSDDQQIPSQRGRLPLLVLEGQWGEARTVAATIVAGGWHGAFMDHARSELGLLARLQGEPALARQMVEAELPAGRATAPGDAPCFLDALLMQHLAAALALDAGDLADARAWLAMNDRWLAWNGSVRGRSEGAALWAEYCRAAGDGERAWQYATRALTDATAPRQPLAALAAHRLLGSLATEAGRPDDAARHLDAALDLAEACAVPYEKALTLLARAALRGATNDRADALRLLDAVRAICTPLGANPALARVDALAARITASGTPQAYPAGLSPREVEVLRLMAAGRTNGEIAAALFLSERTVHAHVRHILTKTDAENRAAATAFAVRNGLA